MGQGKYTPSSTGFEGGLGRSLERYQQMIDEMRAAQKEAAAPISPELQQIADIYKTGGEYGAGARTRIAEAEKAGIASGQAGLVRSGMSSGSLAAGVRSRYSRQAQGQIQEVEDIRYEKLGSALSAVAAAQQARGMQMQQAYTTTAQMMGGFQEPSQSQYADPYKLIRMQQEGQQISQFIQSRYGQSGGTSSSPDWSKAFAEEQARYRSAPEK